jgi:hypothetical protein
MICFVRVTERATGFSPVNGGYQEIAQQSPKVLTGGEYPFA